MAGGHVGATGLAWMRPDIVVPVKDLTEGRRQVTVNGEDTYIVMSVGKNILGRPITRNQEPRPRMQGAHGIASRD